MPLPLRYYQKQAVQNFFSYAENNHGKHPLIVLPTGCLSWDTVINENRCTLGRKKIIKQMYKAFNGLNKHKHHNYDKNYKTYVRSFNGTTIQLNEVESITYSGIKHLYTLTLEDDIFLKATSDHKIMTNNGWKPLLSINVNDDLIMCDTLKSKKKTNHIYKNFIDTPVQNLWYHPYAQRVKTNKEKRGYTLRIEKHRFIYEAHINNLSHDEYKKILRNNPEKTKTLKFIDPSIYDIHHKDFNHSNNDINNLEKLTKEDHQVLHSKKNKFNFNQGMPIFKKIKSIEYYGEDHTYDIGCYENHNFVANGMVVHNSGKSLIQAYIIRNMLKYENTRILCLTHQKYLIEQNYNELLNNFDNDLFLDAGIYSAGLKRRDTQNRILFAGIQSVYKKAWELGKFDLIIIDEAHLVSYDAETMYRQFFSEMEKINPKIMICGMSATPFRMKEGLLTDGDNAIFDDICHDTPISELINPNHFNNHDHKQYLCELISKNAAHKVDLSKVHIRGGEYVAEEMEQAYMANNLTAIAVKEIMQYTNERKKILIFTAGIKHCEEVTAEINKYAEARCVHSEKTSDTNDRNIKEFKKGIYKYLVNINSLTTGFNEKSIDCIVFLRSTKSPGLYCQIAGRGLRMHPDKTNCLVLDFGNNITLHGPIDKIEIRKKDGKTEIGTMPMKECPECGALLFLATMECPDCGYIFPSKDKHDETASTDDILSKYKKPEIIDVDYIHYSRHESRNGKQDTLKVDYSQGLVHYSEWICIEHEGYAGTKARQWMSKRTDEKIATIDEAIEKSDTFRKVNQIIVDFNDKYPKITGHLFEPVEEYKARIKAEEARKEQEFMDSIPF